MDQKVTLTMNEIRRPYVMQQITDKQLTGPQAAALLGLSLRQIRRLIAKYREQGAPGLVHGNRGRAPNNRIEETWQARIWELAKEKYKDYNDSHFTEELQEKHGMKVSRSTVRRIRRKNNQQSPRKHSSPKHHFRRPRKPQAGMLLQTDGSRHDWLEGRGPWLTLIAYIDDATNQVFGASFRDEEDAAGYFLGLEEICLTQGIPAAIYADQHTIFQSPTKATIEQELAGKQPRSQLGRLLDELGMQLIRPSQHWPNWIVYAPSSLGWAEKLLELFTPCWLDSSHPTCCRPRLTRTQPPPGALPRLNGEFCHRFRQCFRRCTLRHRKDDPPVAPLPGDRRHQKMQSRGPLNR